MVGDFFIAPTLVVIETENFPHHLRLGRHHLKLLLAVDDVTIGGGADPLAVLLAAADHRTDLFAGVGDRHLVDEKLKLNLQPIVATRETDVVPDGDDPHPGVPQVLQLHQSPAVPPGKTGEVLDDEDVLLVGHQLPAHGLIPFPLLEGVAGPVPVLIKGEGAVGKLPFDKI